jgi:hypothetical protein
VGNLLHLSGIQLRNQLLDPMFPLQVVGGKQLGGQIPEMLAGVPNVHDLNGTHRVLVRNVPDPLGAVAEHHCYFGAASTALPCFGIDVATE